jgi:hypothetical protein
MNEMYSSNENEASIRGRPHFETSQPEGHTYFFEPTINLARQILAGQVITRQEKFEGHTDTKIGLKDALEQVDGDVMPGLREALLIVDKQAINNLKINHPKAAPGARYTSTVLKVNPEIIRAIAAKMPDALQPQTIKDSGETSATPLHVAGEKFIYFITPPLSTEQDALVHMDEGYNRFMRCLTKVAGAMKRGEPIPEIEIHMFGATTGLGGKETARSLLCRVYTRSCIIES